MDKTIIQLENERLQWSLETFAEATPVSSLRKLEEEIKEIESNLDAGVKDPEEFADALMCLFDAAGRSGVTVEEIFASFAEKLEKNKKRIWKKNPDSSYSHIKNESIAAGVRDKSNRPNLGIIDDAS